MVFLRRFWIGLASALALALAPATAVAQLQVTPAYIETEIQAGRSAGVLTVTNTADTEQRFRAQAVAFAFSPVGQIYETEATSQYSLAEMIKFNPKEFAIPPHGTQTVRFSVVAKQDLVPGEYWAAFKFQPLQVNEASGEGEGRKMSIQVRSSIIIPVYGWVQSRDWACATEDASATAASDGIEIRAVFRNQGNAYLVAQGEYDVLDDAGSVLATGVVGREIVLRGSDRVFATRCTEDVGGKAASVRIRFRTKQMPERIDEQVVPIASVGKVAG